jgi:filamentous hemagglutinin
VAHGSDNVTSTTVANNPTQRVNSDLDKGIEVISNESGKAVKVTYKDPVSGETLKANVPYDSRGLPVFDDVAKYTTKIDESVPYGQQFSRATRDLRDAINSGKVDPKQFTPTQMKAIQQGADKIPDYTWHHNAQSAPNNTQLIPQKVHEPVLHLGQGSLSKGK